MRSYSPTFIGTVIGLLLVPCLPAQNLNDASDLFYHMCIFGSLGFVGGTVYAYYRKKRETNDSV